MSKAPSLKAAQSHKYITLKHGRLSRGVRLARAYFMTPNNSLFSSNGYILYDTMFDKKAAHKDAWI
jgi:hypothetical protein